LKISIHQTIAEWDVTAPNPADFAERRNVGAHYRATGDQRLGDGQSKALNR
jgi:hypothetical protein